MKDNLNTILDKEIASKSEDAFGHSHFASVLQYLVETHIPPYSVGLLGKWGVGKTSVKKIYLQELQDDSERKTKIHTISFNAWRYGGDKSIKRALLREVFLNFGGNEDEIKQKLYHQVNKAFFKLTNWKDYFIDLFKSLYFLVPLATIMVLLGLLLILLPLSIQTLNIKNELVIICVYLFVLFLCGFIFKSVLERKDFIKPIYSNVNSIEFPITTSEEYEEALKQQFKEFKKKNKSIERVLIFIDDLDRLSAEEMVDGIDAIRTFMEIPNLDTVFVISCDEDRVADALSKRAYCHSLPGTISTISDARRYLDRIFHFRLEIPPFPKQDMRQFAINKIKEVAPEFETDIVKQELKLENFINYLIHVDVQSPRNAIQLINAFLQCWWIAKKREFDGQGSEKAGGLSDGSVTNYPRQLAIINVFKVDFPEFYYDLIKDSRLIEYFKLKFINSNNINTKYPDVINSLLNKYCEKNGNNTIKEEFKPLRRYISSLDGLHWPKSIEPLILLTQDPLSRKFGDLAPQIKSEFVSGNTKGILELIGRENDNKELTADNIHYLTDIYEEIRNTEVEERQNNAATVVADLAERCPAGQAEYLLSPLSQRSAESNDLRYRLGIDKLVTILERLKDISNRQYLTSRIIEDLLLNKSLTFKLENGDEPSLDQAINIVKKACEVVLKIKSEIGLLEEDNTKLLAWLQNRTVKVSKNSKVIEFEYLFNFANQYKSLLDELNHNYSSQLILELGENEALEIDVETAINNLKYIFNSMIKQGTETQNILWQQLITCSAVNHYDIVNFSYDYLLEKIDKIDTNTVNSFIITSINTLDTLEFNDNQTVNGLIEKLLKVLEIKHNQIKDNTVDKFDSLLSNLIKSEDNCDLALKLLDQLLLISQESTSNLTQSWYESFFVDLNQNILVWLAKNYGRFTEDTKKKLLNVLLAKFQSNSYTDQDIIIFKSFNNNIPSEIYSTDSELNKYLGQVYTHMFSLCRQYQSNYPIINKQFEFAPITFKLYQSNELGNMLQNTFSQAFGLREHHNLLHSLMINYWPEKNKNTGNYDPQSLFDLAHKAVLEGPNQKHIIEVYKSAYSMLEDNIIPKNPDNAGNIHKLYKMGKALFVKIPEQITESLTSLPFTENFFNHQEIFEFSKVDITKEPAKNALQKIWIHIFKECDLNKLLQVSFFVIGQQPKDGDDSLLEIFVEALKESKEDYLVILEAIILDTNINENNKKRFWLKIEKDNNIANNLNWLSSLIEKLFSCENTGLTIKEIINYRAKITDLYDSEEKKFDFGKTLLNSFKSVNSLEYKRNLVKWVKELGNKSIWKEIDKKNLTEDEITILVDEVPSEFKNLKKQKESSKK